MTARQIWEGMLTELSKVNAPSMLLQDFNYFFNKAINQYINKRYNIYDVNQQTTDDLRVLKATTILDVSKTSASYNNTISAGGESVDLSSLAAGSAKLFGGTYETILPKDYLHLLNCICIYKVKKNFKCYNADDYVQFAAKRLTADSWSVILNDYYNRPLPWRPYYYIHNVNITDEVPTNPITDTNKNGTDIGKLYGVIPGTDPDDNGGVDDTANKKASNFPRTIKLGSALGDDTIISTVEKETAMRYGNASNVRLEIRYGSDDSIFTLEKVFVDYIKAPQVIRLTQEQVNLTEDTSQIMEFPDYVCQEIINELTMLVMENTADPRLQTNMAVTQSIANPAQQQTQTQPQQQRG